MENKIRQMCFATTLLTYKNTANHWLTLRRLKLDFPGIKKESNLVSKFLVSENFHHEKVIQLF